MVPPHPQQRQLASSDTAAQTSDEVRDEFSKMNLGETVYYFAYDTEQVMIYPLLIAFIQIWRSIDAWRGYNSV